MKMGGKRAPSARVCPKVSEFAKRTPNPNQTEKSSWPECGKWETRPSSVGVIQCHFDNKTDFNVFIMVLETDFDPNIHLSEIFGKNLSPLDP